MITANHKRIWGWFFILYAKVHLKRLYKEIRILDVTDKQDIQSAQEKRAVILISNHFSFWDGFIHLIINREVFKKRIYIMMLYQQLKKRQFLRYGGCFSVDPGKREIIDSLKYSSSILNDSSNMLLIFPQGEIQSLYVNNYIFGRGIEYIISKAPKADIYFNTNLINFFSDKRPTMTIYYKRYIPENRTIKEIESAYNLFATDCRSMESSQVKGVNIL
ncbi:MAG: 1-acyl-sn-glycerol-3-phosphate acyltransferase [Bacteroidales bacterium]|nr:1-acyl-sn-glycerol-3-phosphate acyltransferase [Bacteroidales bacterium]